MNKQDKCPLCFNDWDLDIQREYSKYFNCSNSQYSFRYSEIGKVVFVYFLSKNLNDRHILWWYENSIVLYVDNFRIKLNFIPKYDITLKQLKIYLTFN
jgi:hypothetical protein